MRKLFLALLLIALPVCALAQTELELEASPDDTLGIKWPALGGDWDDENKVGSGSTTFGRGYVSGNIDTWTFLRYESLIPFASKMIIAKLRFKASASNSGDFNTTIYRLVPDTKWDGAGYTLGNYATCSALLLIFKFGTSVAWNNVEVWTVDNWYDSPEIPGLFQELIDASGYTYGDPIGLMVDDGDGVHAPHDERRSPYQWDSGAHDKGTKAVVTFEPWGEIMVIGGYKVRDGELVYFGY